MAKIVRCKVPFGFEDNGMTRVISTGMLVDASDVAYRDFKDYFEEVETHVDQQKKLAARAANRMDGNVEQATAAPGEKRATIRVAPPKTVASAGAKADDATVKTEEKTDGDTDSKK